MSAIMSREQLHRNIDKLPDELIEQIANYTEFVIEKRKSAKGFSDWQDSQWQEFGLAQFFDEEDGIEYSLEDAQEIYKP